MIRKQPNEAEWQLYFLHMREYHRGGRMRPRPPLQYGSHIDSLPKQHCAPRIPRDHAVVMRICPAAAIEAGFRKRPTPVEQVLKALPKLTRAQLLHVRARINESGAKREENSNAGSSNRRPISDAVR
jgi:hypothetical protein